MLALALATLLVPGVVAGKAAPGPPGVYLDLVTWLSDVIKRIIYCGLQCILPWAECTTPGGVCLA